MNNATLIRNHQLAVQNLTKLEEIVIVNYILDRDSRGFPPRQANVEDIANYLQKCYRAKPVGKL
jgi:hypothetical protein